MIARNALVTVLVAVFAALTSGQSPNPPRAADARDVKLAGDRFRPLTYGEMSPQQRTMVEHLVAGERGGTGGPFNVLLRSPEMGDAAQQLGAQLRFHSSLQPRVKEMAILIVARHWTAQYEWYAHKRLALQAGLKPEIVAAISAGTLPDGLQPDEQAVYTFATELLDTKQVGDATFQSAVRAVSERGVVDLIGLMGYYSLVSMVLNVDRYPLPDGAKPELRTLAR